MKKLVVLMALLVIAGMLWAQAPAAPSYPQTTIGALVSYMGVTDLGGYKAFSDRPDIEFKWTIKTDDFNSVYIELDGESTDGIGGTGLVTKAIEQPFDRAWFTTDLGKALKLPVGVVSKIGFEEWKNKDGNKVTKGEWEDIIGKGFKKWGAQIEVMPAPVVTLRGIAAFNQDETGAGKGGFAMVGGYGAQGPVAWEAAYYTNGKATLDKGFIEGGVKFAQDMTKDVNLAVVANGIYDMFEGFVELKDPLTGNSFAPTLFAEMQPYWQVGVGVNLMYQKMASLGIGWRGESWKFGKDAIIGGVFTPNAISALDSELGTMQIDLWAMPIAGTPLELFATLGLGLGDSDIYDNMFDSAEVSLKYTIGKAYFYVGFLYNNEGGYFVAKEAADLDVYPKADLTNYITYIDEAVTAVFIRFALAL